MAISSAQAIYGMVCSGDPSSPLASGTVQIGVDQTRVPLTAAVDGYAISATMTSNTNTLALNVETGQAVGTTLVKPFLTIGTNNAAVTYTGKNYGDGDESITVTHATPAALAVDETVSVTGEAITVTPAAKARMTVTGTLTSDGSTPVVVPTLFYAGENDDKPMFTDTGENYTFEYMCYWANLNSRWYLAKGLVFWESLDQVATPDLCTTWTAVPPATGTPTVTKGTSDANQVAAAVNAAASAFALVTASAGGTGLSAVVTAPAANLAGGDGTQISGGSGNDWEGVDVPDLSTIHGLLINVTTGSATASNGTHTFPLPAQFWNTVGFTGDLITATLTITATADNTVVNVAVLGSDA